LREIKGQAGPSTGIQLLSPGLSHSGNKPLARHGLDNKESFTNNFSKKTIPHKQAQFFPLKRHKLKTALA
jgi:hypothetical protein